MVLEYELRRVGPSGVGKIELWLTRNDGETWEAYAEDRDVPANAPNHRHKRAFELRESDGRPFADGIYGMTLVVKNRAGAGKTPRPGDSPEIRIEVDTKPPEVKLKAPIADPKNPDHVLLRWIATDKNLAAAPITLEYAEKRDGPWQPIASDLENSGHFSWKVGPEVPVQVYLRMRGATERGTSRRASRRIRSTSISPSRKAPSSACRRPEKDRDNSWPSLTPRVCIIRRGGIFLDRPYRRNSVILNVGDCGPD